MKLALGEDSFSSHNANTISHLSELFFRVELIFSFPTSLALVERQGLRQVHRLQLKTDIPDIPKDKINT